MSSIPQKPSRLPIVILLLMAVGVPTAAGLAFAERVTQNPWQALGLALLYELVVLVFGFVANVWQRLEQRWVDRIADWLDAWVQALLGGRGYRKRYLQHLIYRHRAFDVKGLTTQGIYTLELEQVSVKLGVAPQPAHLASADPSTRCQKPYARGATWCGIICNPRRWLAKAWPLSARRAAARRRCSST